MHYAIFRLASDLIQGSFGGTATLDATVNVSKYHHPAVLADLSGVGSWVSPVIDSGDPRTAWFVAEWYQVAIPASNNFTITTGNTSSPDGSWSSVTSTSPHRKPGNPYVVTGLASVKPGRYAQVTIRLPASTVVTPSFFRDLMIYYWVMENEAFFSPLRPGSGTPAVGQIMQAFLGALASVATSTKARGQDFVDGIVINKALDAQLVASANDFRFGWPTNMPQEACRRCLLAKIQSRKTGQESLDFIREQVALFLGVDPSTVIVTGTSAFTYSVAIPHPIGTYFPGLPGVPSASVPDLVQKCFVLPVDFAP